MTVTPASGVIIVHEEPEGNETQFARYWAGEQIGFANVISRGAEGPWLAELWVHPDYRGQGVASALLAEVIRTCAGQRLELCPDPFELPDPAPSGEHPDRGQLAAWYARHGFAWTGETMTREETMRVTLPEPADTAGWTALLAEAIQRLRGTDYDTAAARAGALLRADGASQLVRAAEAAGAQLGDPGFVTDPCRQGSHDCRFRLCRCPGHQAVPPGRACALAAGQ